MNKLDSAVKLPIPDEWQGLNIPALLETANKTSVGKKTKRWHDVEVELIRLHNRRQQIAGDKVMASVIDQRISDSEKSAHQLASAIADTPARNAVDIICKLAVSRRLHCGEEDPGTKLSESALLDLVRFVQTFQQKTG